MGADADLPNQPFAMCLALTRAHALLSNAMDRALSNAHGLSYGEFLILFHIRSSPEAKLRRIELAEHVGLTASGVTRALVPLEKRGLVTRASDERDARVAFACLTRAGLQHCADALATAQSVATSLAPTLSSMAAGRDGGRSRQPAAPLPM